MKDILFKDYINKYKEINKEEWIVLFEKNEEKDLENDIYTFCALIDKDKVYDNDYMKRFDWKFTTDSFGKGGFGAYGLGNEKELYYYDGTTYEEFEYLIAIRYFDKYDNVIEINPKFIWYKNLVKQNEGYVDPITDELTIKVEKCCIAVKRQYLKDYLSAIHKVCIIAFDHRRYFHASDVECRNEVISDNDYYMLFSINTTRGWNYEYDGISSLIGKVIIHPFKKPHHNDYKYFAEDKEYETFIIDYDESEDEKIEFTCNENELSNYFGANPEAPHFLTPVFFNIKVLEKYKNDPRNYVINDSTISFLSEWSIPFNINKEGKVSVWLGDLGRIPFEEQKYWKNYNIVPEGEMNSKFIDSQLRGLWTDAIRIESKLVPSIDRFNQIIKDKYNDTIFKKLNKADEEIYNTFMIPLNYSVPEYQSFLMKLCKIAVESISIKTIKKVMGSQYTDEVKEKSSIGQLGEFLKFSKLDENEKIANALKKAYGCRNKLSGHAGSFEEYNKIWGRAKDYNFNSVEDARHLLEEIISAFEYVTTVYEVTKNES